MPIINDKNFTQLTNLNVTGDLYVKGSPSGALAGDNVSIGVNALEELDNTRNVAIGELAMSDAQSADANVAIGDGAMQSIVDGAAHTAIGLLAMANQLDGFWNTALGSEALLESTTSVSNTAIGAQAQLLTTSGSFNCSFGAFAGQDITTGEENICIGYVAGENIDAGSRNIIIGVSLTTANGDDQLNIGDLITGDLAAQHLSLNLPTSDPSISGVLWNDAGTVKVSV